MAIAMGSNCNKVTGFITQSKKTFTTTEVKWSIVVDKKHHCNVALNKELYNKLLQSTKNNTDEFETLTYLGRKYNVFPRGLGIEFEGETIRDVVFPDSKHLHHLVSFFEDVADIVSAICIKDNIRGCSRRALDCFFDSLVSHMSKEHCPNNKTFLNDVYRYTVVLNKEYEGIFTRTLFVVNAMCNFYDYLAMCVSIMSDVNACKDPFLKRLIKMGDIVHIAAKTHKYEVFKENPYSVDAINFEVRDRFAAVYNVGLELKVVENARHQLHEKMMNGHTCYYLKTIVDLVKQNSIHDDIAGLSKEQVLDIVSNSDYFDIVTQFDKKVMLYMKNVHHMETYIVSKLADYIEQAIQVEERGCDSSLDKDVIDCYITEYEQNECLEFSATQKQAIHCAFKGKGIMLLTGGPGTGKSSLVKCVCYICDQLKGAKKLRYTFCAPTGKAANRLGDKGKTIHRALEATCAGSTFTFKKNERNLVTDDIFIVDEVSMIDLFLMYSILCACSSHQTTLILVGDPNQLPSVSYGNVLRDLCSTDIVPHIHLSKVYRQDPNSTILNVARSIVKGVVPKSEYLSSSDVCFIESSDPEEIKQHVWDIYLKHSELRANTKEIGIQTISATKKGQVATIEMNKYLHSKLYDCPLEDFMFRSDEKLICTSNVYAKDPSGEILLEHSLFNGENGMFSRFLDNQNMYVKKQTGVSVLVDKKTMDLGHCITVHKSQGSEYDVVIVILHKCHGRLLNREIFYTAVTRAKSRLYILGDRESLKRCVETPSMQRISYLANRLEAEFDGDD